MCAVVSPLDELARWESSGDGTLEGLPQRILRLLARQVHAHSALELSSERSQPRPRQEHATKPTKVWSRALSGGIDLWLTQTLVMLRNPDTKGGLQHALEPHLLRPLKGQCGRRWQSYDEHRGKGGCAAAYQVSIDWALSQSLHDLPLTGRREAMLPSILSRCGCKTFADGPSVATSNPLVHVGRAATPRIVRHASWTPD